MPHWGRLDASCDQHLRRLVRVDLLLAADLWLSAMAAIGLHDIHKIGAERDRRSTGLTSNLDPKEWLALTCHPVLA